VGKAAEVGHGFEAVEGIEGADEDSSGFAGTMRGDVEAVVHAVDEVDIGVSGWAEEDCVVGSEAAGRVGCRVDEAEVGFDFDDAGGEAFALEVADEELAEEGPGYSVGGAGVEASWEEFWGVTGLWGRAHIFGSDIFCVTHAPRVRGMNGAPQEDEWATRRDVESPDHPSS
jgi:hypothetical protein